MWIEGLIQELKSSKWYNRNLVRVEKLPARVQSSGQFSLQLSPAVDEFLKQRGITNLYSHQLEAIQKIFQGKNLIITTSTASGKTLCFLIPLLEAIAQDAQTRAILIYPLKALSNDQLQLLREIQGLNFKAEIYDGDTPSSKRPYIREEANIILTNPYELHQILPYHFKWSNFFRNLKYVVIDEAHTYRGVFGSHISNLFFRFKRILRYYSSRPRYIISTASIGNPLEFAHKLVREDFCLIEQDGSPQSEKVILFWNSKNSELSYLLQVKEIFSRVMDLGFKTICFLKSRRACELLKSWLADYGSRVASYRAGYLPQARREIEQGLRRGEIQGVLATNALELGIDIGELEVAIIVGFPGSISSFWQQAGRAGRRGRKALIIYLALEDALEQYLLQHPQILLNPKFEKVNLQPENLYISTRHLICAGSELPVKEEEVSNSRREILNKLEEKNILSKTVQGYIYIGGGRPQAIVSLDNISQDLVEVVVEGKLLESMDLQRALRELYPGAVYLSQGRSYRVKKFELKDKVVELEKKVLDYYTQIVKIEEVEVKEKFDSLERESFLLNFGLARIREKFLGYQIKKFEQVIGFKELDLPDTEFMAHTIWLELSPLLREQAISRGLDFEGGLHGLEHLLTGLAPLVASSDSKDLGGRAYPEYLQFGSPCIFIFESYPGGVGIVERLWQEFNLFLDISQKHILKCGCKSGCPSCILSPECGNSNKPMSKEGTIFILNFLSSQNPTSSL